MALGSKQKEALFSLLALLNIAAIFIGAYYYWGQILQTSLPLLVFVPDCPLFVLLSLPLLLGIAKSDSYSFFASSGMVLYGTWTVFVLLYHWQYYFAEELALITAAFIIGHIGMVFEGIALAPKRASAKALLFAILFFLVSAYADYFLGTHPLIPEEGLETVRNLTFAAAILFPALLYFFTESLQKLAPARLFMDIIYRHN